MTGFVDKSLFTTLPIHPEDRRQGIPIREVLWGKVMFGRLDYAERLGLVQAPTLIVAGRHDPEAPPPCSRHLQAGIAGAQLVTFKRSGHFPFIEEPKLFTKTVAAFLNG